MNPPALYYQGNSWLQVPYDVKGNVYRLASDLKSRERS